MKISCVTPSIRKDMLEIVDKCLKRQVFKDFEWLVGSPKDYGFGIWVEDPPKMEGEFYKLNASWNAGLKQAKGELFVSIVDGLWFPPETLERLYQHYERDPMSCISFAGHHYDKTENGKPEHLVWVDPKVKDIGSLEQISPVDFELCIASMPMKGIKNVGGFDEEFDRFPAWSEKELACRMERVGYKFYIDHSIQFRAVHHPRLKDSEWDKKFPESSVYFQKCVNEIQAGTRKALDFLDEK